MPGDEDPLEAELGASGAPSVPGGGLKLDKPLGAAAKDDDDVVGASQDGQLTAQAHSGRAENEEEEVEEQEDQDGRPELCAGLFVGQVRENERSVEVKPRLSIVNPQVELCDFELLPDRDDGQESNLVPKRETRGELFDGQKVLAVNNNKLHSNGQSEFAITWVDRVNGWAKLEAKDEQSMDCERRANYSLRVRAVACNGLKSKE